MLEMIDEALTSIGERTMMDVHEVQNILLDLRNELTQPEGETHGVIQEGTGPLVGVGQRSS